MNKHRQYLQPPEQLTRVKAADYNNEVIQTTIY